MPCAAGCFRLAFEGGAGLLRSDLLIEFEESAAPTLTHLLAPWCNWLTRRPLKAESSGSIPDGATKVTFKRFLANIAIDGAMRVMQLRCKAFAATPRQLLSSYHGISLFIN